MWSVFGVQRSLGSRAVMSGAIVSHYYRTMSYIKDHFLQLFEEVEDYTLYTKYDLYAPK